MSSYNAYVKHIQSKPTSLMISTRSIIHEWKDG